MKFVGVLIAPIYWFYIEAKWVWCICFHGKYHGHDTLAVDSFSGWDVEGAYCKKCDWCWGGWVGGLNWRQHYPKSFDIGKGNLFVPIAMTYLYSVSALFLLTLYGKTAPFVAPNALGGEWGAFFVSSLVIIPTILVLWAIFGSKH